MSITEKGNDPLETLQSIGIIREPVVLPNDAFLKAQLAEFTIQNAIDAVVWLDKTGTILYVNNAACKMVGYSEEELLSMTVFDINPSMTHQRWDSLWATRQSKEGLFFEGQSRRKDGEICPVEILSKSFIYEGKEYIVATIRDITQRKKTEDELRGKVAFFEALVNSTSDGVLVDDNNWNTLFINQKTIDLWAVPDSIARNPGSEEWGKYVLGMVDNPNELRSHLYHLQENPSEVFEGELTLKNGTVLERHSRPVVSKDGQYYGRVWTFRDVTENRKWIDRLAESEERNRTIIDNSNDGIAICKVDKFMYVNPKWLEMFGFSDSSEVIGKYTLAFVHPDDMDRVVRLVEEGMRASGQAPKRYEYKAIRKDGQAIYAEVSWSAFTLHQERYIVAFLRDITERRSAEESLWKNRLQLAEAMELAKIVYWEVDRTANEMVFNDAFYKLYGTTFEEVGSYRMSFAEYVERFIHQEDRQRILAEVSLLQENEADVEVVQFEHRALRSDGKPMYVLSRSRNAKGVATGQVVRVFGANYDVTELKIAEEALRESERRYRDLFDNSPVGLMEVDSSGPGAFIDALRTSGIEDLAGYGMEHPEEVVECLSRMRFVDVNKIVLDIYGVANKEEFYEAYSTFLHQAPTEILLKGFVDIAEGKDRIEAEIMHVTHTEKTLWLNMVIATLPGYPRNTSRVIISVIDVTEKKIADEERQRLQTQLRQSQKMEAIGTLAGGIAHDFNNILTVLTGYGTLLQMKIGNKDAARVYVDQIMAASQKAANLTGSLLAFSRQQPISLVPVNLNTLIKGTEKLLKRLLTEDIKLEARVDNQERTIMADVTQIDQILFNLITNARDAMSTGGSILIETKVVRLDENFTKIHGFGKPGEYVLLAISDTGTGMDDETKEKVFVPFFTTKAVGRGTGLGLSTVFGIVKQHSGYITLYSERGIGTTFHIYFPVTIITAQETEYAEMNINKGTEVILVAEDNKAVRGLITELLTDWGYTVIEAENGEDAVDKFKENKDITLLIIDSVMPKKNGGEAYDEIRKINRSVKVIFMSGYTRDVILDKGIEDRSFDFIQKPIHRGVLLSKVREVLDRPKQQKNSN
jgi:two-component system, cell cycle sensor histidine kinase and response regulator CckA